MTPTDRAISDLAPLAACRTAEEVAAPLVVLAFLDRFDAGEFSDLVIGE